MPFPVTRFHPGSGSQSPRFCLVTSGFHSLCVYLYIKTQTRNYKLKRAHDSFQVHLSKQKSSVTVRWPDCSTDTDNCLPSSHSLHLSGSQNFTFVWSTIKLLSFPISLLPGVTDTILPNKQKSGRGLGKALPSVEKGWTLLNHPFSSLPLELECDV